MDPVTGAVVGAAVQSAAQQSANLKGIIYNELTHERDKKEQIEAEQRANAEFDRRMQVQQDQWQERFDKENEYNHPSRQAQRLREAGVNPLSALMTSPTPSSSGSNATPSTNEAKSPVSKNWNPQSNAEFLDAVILGKRLENETVVSNAEANKLNAEADRLRGQEGRDVDKHPIELQSLLANVENTELKNRILYQDAIIKEYTAPNEMALSDKELEIADNTIKQQIADILLTEASVDEKRQNIVNLQEQAALLRIQQEAEKVGIKLTQAQVKETYQNISLMSAQELEALSRDYANIQQAEVFKAQFGKIEAETKEIPKNARVARNRQRIGMITDLSSEALKWFGAIATGGASSAASNIITSATGADVKDTATLVGFGNTIR